jgi:hypothetical protein
MNFSARAIRSLLRLLPPGMILPILTGRLRGRKWIVGSGVHGCWISSYELENSVHSRKSLLWGREVLNLDANVRFHTLLLPNW